MPSEFECPPEHRVAMEAVKQRIGLQHSLLDNWVYLFLANKSYNVEETIMKLQRRSVMERSELLQYTITPFMHASLSSGTVQYMGRDKEGRPVLYFNTVRDRPKASERSERVAGMDMFLSWALRCDPDNPTSTVTWLINYQGASMLYNADLVFQKDMALRISKYYPGTVAKMLICNMNRAFTFIMKPLMNQLPKSLRNCIILLSQPDIRNGRLLDFIDADVLPADLGGHNTSDGKLNHELFADTVEKYFLKCQAGLRSGIGVKQTEMMDAFLVDQDGCPLSMDEAHKATRTELPQINCHDCGLASLTGVDQFLTNISEAGNTTVDDILNTAVSVSDEPPFKWSAGSLKCDTTLCYPISVHEASSILNGCSATDDVLSDVTPRTGVETMHSCRSLSIFESASADSLTLLPFELPSVEELARPCPCSSSSFFCTLNDCETATWQHIRARFRGLSVELVPLLTHLMGPNPSASPYTENLPVFREHGSLLLQVSRAAFAIFQPTKRPLTFSLHRWIVDTCHVGDVDGLRVPSSIFLDCSSFENILLSIQAAVMEYVRACEDLLAMGNAEDRLLRRLLLTWPSGMSYYDLMACIEERAICNWNKLTNIFQHYMEATVAMSIADYMRSSGLVESNGTINTKAKWYCDLFTGIIQYREQNRKKWLFHVFPPLFRDDVMRDGPPTMTELLRNAGMPRSVDGVGMFLSQSMRALLNTQKRVAPGSALHLATGSLVEEYLQETFAKISMPYEACRGGSTPNDLFVDEQENAYLYLLAAEGPLREYLYGVASLFLLQENAQRGMDRLNALDTLSAMRGVLHNSVAGWKRAKNLAISLGKGANMLHESLRADAAASDESPCENCPTDGYALALQLLWAAIYFTEPAEHLETGRGKVRSGSHQLSKCDFPSDTPTSRLTDAVHILQQMNTYAKQLASFSISSGRRSEQE